MKKVLILFVIFSLCGFSQGDQELKNLSLSRNKDTAWVNDMIEIFARKTTHDQAGLIPYMKLTESVATKLNYLDGQIEASLHVSGAYINIGNIDSVKWYINKLNGLLSLKKTQPALAVFYLQKGKLKELEGDSKGAMVEFANAIAAIDTNKEGAIFARIIANRAGLKSNLGESLDAYNDYIASSKLFSKLGMKAELAVIYNNLGRECGNLELWKESVDYYLKAIALNKEINNLRQLGMNYVNLGASYSRMDSLDAAIRYYRESIKISKELDLRLDLAQGYMNLGNIYFQKKDYTRALDYYGKSLAICYQNDIKYGIMLSHINRGDVYAIDGSELRAIRSYDSALVYAKLLQTGQLEYDIYHRLGKVYEKTGNYKLALEYQKKYFNYKDSLNSKETSSKILELEKKYQTEKQALEITRLENETANQNLLIIVLLLAFLVSTGFVFLFLWKRRIAQKQELIALNQAAEIQKISDALKESNEWKDKLFAVIAHDLKGPFFPILNLSEIIATEMDTLSRDEIVQYATGIRQASSGVYLLIENLLDWARIRTNKIIFDSKPVLINKLIKEAIINLHSPITTKKILVKNLIEKEVIINGDDRLLYSIFQNLIHNAVKFSHPCGEIEITSTSDEKNIKISIIDHGIGMDEKKAEKLFIFEKVVSTRGTGNEKGTGLGLSLTAEFVALHGGTIDVKSKEHEGTTVTIKFLK